MITIGEIYAIQIRSINQFWNKYYSVNFDKDSHNYKQGLYMWYYIFTTLTGYYLTLSFLGQGLGDFSLDFIHDGSDDLIIAYVFLIITFLIPSLITAVCMVIQWRALKKAKVAVDTSVENNKHSHVTKTILLLTISFVICNTASIAFVTVISFLQTFRGKDGLLKDDTAIHTFYRLVFFFQSTLPLINSTINPIIFMVRGTALKNYVLSVIRRFVDCNNQSSRDVVISTTVNTTNIELQSS